MEIRGLCWLGTRTPAFAETVAFFGSTLELPLGAERPGFARFDFPGGGALEVFDTSDRDHAHFTTGPVVGFEVGDFDAARIELGNRGYELARAPGGSPGGYRWQHFRGPEGVIFEIVDRPTRPRPRPPTGDVRIARISWMGISTPRYDEFVAFYRDALGLPAVEATPDLIECALPDGSTVEAFRRNGSMDHAHFRTGPVPGLEVADLGSAIRQLEERGVTILEMRTRPFGGWAHFRSPDGQIYELKQSARD